jgi:pimeloyl-ACP methyl ester carboxylesterase
VQIQADDNITAHLVQHAYSALLTEIDEPVILVTHSQSGSYGWKLADSHPESLAAVIGIEPSARPFENWRGPPFEPGYIANFPNFTYGIGALPLHFDPPLENNDASLLRRKIAPPPNSTLSPCILQADPARQLPRLAKVPILQLTSESSYHAVFDYCTAKFLKQAGVDVDFVPLGSIEIHGNGHFLFMEKNNLEIAETVVKPWLKKRGL